MEDFIVTVVLFAIESWRMTTVVIASTVLAVGLAITIPPFTGPYGIALVLLGFGVGMWWHSKALEIKARNA